MGSNASQERIASDIKQQIEREVEFMESYEGEYGEPFLDVQIERAPPRNNRHTYKIQLEDRLAEDKELLILFPYHPSSNRRILDATGWKYSGKLAKEINLRNQQSSTVGVESPLGVVYENRIWRIRGFTGKLYLVSGKMNKSTINNVQTDIRKALFLIETNGKSDITSVVPLCEELQRDNDIIRSIHRPFNVKYPALGKEIFSCDADPRKAQPTRVKTLSRSAVEQEMHMLLVPGISDPVLEDQISSGSDDSFDADLDVELSMEPAMTPRFDMALDQSEPLVDETE